MKMSLKLIILFSILAIIVTSAFSMISYQSNINNLYSSTATSLTTLGTKMQAEIEQYFKLMNFSVEELSSNIEFMDSFYTISTGNEINSENLVLPALTRMSQIMYQSPLQSEFYRVSAYNDDGFFISNIFEKTDSVVPYSDEAKETVASIDCLQYLKENPFKTVILGVRVDPWATKSDILVFSLIKAAVWHGKVIGYFEVSSELYNMTNIFLNLENEGLSTQAIFDDGTDLFRTYQDDIVYEDLPVGQVTTYKIDGASDRWVIRLHSDMLDLNIYASQEIDSLGSSRSEILIKSLLTMLPILALSILFIIFISYKLTGSIRKLSKKIKNLPADNFLSRSDLSEPTTVVKPGDHEMYELEQSFNTMLTTLRASHANEVALREGSLKAQLDALQVQINPHFIYNTLNIISAKGLESGNEEICELCDKFAGMLRYSTDTRSQTATVNQEIENARQYLILCKSRFEDMLEYEIDVPEELMNITIPKLTIQPLVENCMKYGTKNSGQSLHILIKGTISDKELKLIIRDNGSGFDWETLNKLQRAFKRIESMETPEEVSAAEHIGLINTVRRLFYYSKGKIHMNLYNDNGAVVELIQDLD